MSIEGVAQRLQSSSASEWVRSIDWLVPLLQAIHIVMIGVVFVSILVTALRVLGWVRADEPIGRVWARFAPFLWTGVIVMLFTGLVLTLGEPVREVMTMSFRIKMLLVAVGVVSAALFGRSVRSAVQADGGSAPLPAGTRAASVATVLLWLFIIFLGRAIAYDDSVWGSWSPAAPQQSGGPA
jgi:hypothetical protein